MNQHFDITNHILLSSQTLQHLQSDCSPDTGANFLIPDCFFDVINYSFTNIYHIQKFIEKNTDIFNDMINYDFVAKEFYENILSKSKYFFDKNLKLLEFYDFLNVDEKYITEIVCRVGEYIEQKGLHLIENLNLAQTNILFKHYPILNYYKDLNNKELPKYVTPYFHENIKSYNISDYSGYGNLVMVKYLADEGVDDVVIMMAIENGHLEVIRYLVSLGTNIRDKNDYAVRLASENGYLEMVKYLVSIGADIRAKNDYAVRHASKNGHLEVVRYLAELSIGADIRAKNDYAVRLASKNGHLEVVRYLAEL